MMIADIAAETNRRHSPAMPPQPHVAATEGDEAARLRARLDLALAIAARKCARRRPEDTSRTRRTMWDLLRWTYVAQRVRARAWSVGQWSDVLFALDMPDGPACAYHIDAVAVHAAVSMLPPHQREAVWSAAACGAMPPQPHPEARPIFRPVEREGRGRTGPVTLRYWHGCMAPLRLKPAELERLAAMDAHKDRETVISEGGARWKYRYDPRKVTYRRAATQPTLIDRDTGRVRSAPSVLAEVEVEVGYCPLRWVVDIADLAGQYHAYAHFHAGLSGVRAALGGHLLFGTALDGIGAPEPPPPAVWMHSIPTRMERETIDAAWTLAGAAMATE